MAYIVYSQRNATAAAYDTALRDFLTARGHTVEVVIGTLAAVEWSGVALLIIGAPGTNYTQHVDMAVLDSYDVNIVTLCRNTARLAFLMCDGTVAATIVNQTRRVSEEDDSRAIFSYLSFTSASINVLTLLTPGTTLAYQTNVTTSVQAGVATRQRDQYARVFWGYHRLDLHSDALKTLFSSYTTIGLAGDIAGLSEGSTYTAQIDAVEGHDAGTVEARLYDPVILPLSIPAVQPPFPAVPAMEWSPDGRYLAVVVGGWRYSITGTIKRLYVYEWIDGAAVEVSDFPYDLNAGWGTIHGIAWSPDSRHLALAVSGPPYTVVYDWISGSPVLRAFSGVNVGSFGCLSVSWSPENDFLLFTSEAFPYAWFFRYNAGPDTFTTANLIPGDEPYAAAIASAWSPDGTYVGVGHTEAAPVVGFYQNDSQGNFLKLAGVPQPPPDIAPYEPRHFAWSADSRYCAVGLASLFTSATARRFMVYDFSVSPPVEVSPEILGTVMSTHFTSAWLYTGRYLLASTGFPHVYDWESGTPLKVPYSSVIGGLARNLTVRAMKFAPAGDLLAISTQADSGGTTLRIFEYDDAETLSSYEIQWRDADAPFITGSAVVEGYVDQCYQVTGLQDWTLYEVRVREVSIDTGAVGAWSDWLSVRTLPPPPPPVAHHWPFEVDFEDWVGNAVTEPVGGVSLDGPNVLYDYNRVVFSANSHLLISSGKSYINDWTIGFIINSATSNIFYLDNSGHGVSEPSYLLASWDHSSRYLVVQAGDIAGNATSFPWYEVPFASIGSGPWVVTISQSRQGIQGRIDLRVISANGLDVAMSELLPRHVVLTIGNGAWFGKPEFDSNVGELFVLERPSLHRYYMERLLNNGRGGTLRTAFGFRLYAAFAQEFNTAFGSYPATADERVFSIASGIEAAFSAAYSIARAGAAEQVLLFPDNLARATAQELSASGDTILTGQRHVALIPSQHRVQAPFSARYVNSTPVLQSISFSQTDNLRSRQPQSFQFNALIEYPVSRLHLYSIPSQILVSSVYVAGLDVPRTPVAAAISLLYNSSILIGSVHSVPVVSSSPVAAPYTGTADAAEKDFVAARHRIVYSLENRTTVVEDLVSGSPQ